MVEDKVRENRLRRMAERQGYTLKKVRRCDPRAIDYGSYVLVDQRNRPVRIGAKHATIDDVEAFLTR